jgi:phosphatidylglycerophosphatase A
MNTSTLRLHFLTLFLSGKAPKAPGTVGSFVALVMGVALLKYIPIDSFVLITILISVVAIKQIDIYEKETNSHDDKSIVIDELIGMWLALAICNENLIFAFVSFLCFRYFDIAKPSIIGKIDKNVKGGLGVVLDDVVAGIFGGILSKLIYHLYLWVSI